MTNQLSSAPLCVAVVAVVDLDVGRALLGGDEFRHGGSSSIFDGSGAYGGSRPRGYSAGFVRGEQESGHPLPALLVDAERRRHWRARDLRRVRVDESRSDLIDLPVLRNRLAQFVLGDFIGLGLYVGREGAGGEDQHEVGRAGRRGAVHRARVVVAHFDRQRVEQRAVQDRREPAMTPHRLRSRRQARRCGTWLRESVRRSPVAARRYSMAAVPRTRLARGKRCPNP
jgi:hypothetical protein